MNPGDASFYGAVLQGAAALLGLSFVALSHWLGKLLDGHAPKPSSVKEFMRFFEADPLYVYLAWDTAISLGLFVLPFMIASIYLALGFESLLSRILTLLAIGWAGATISFATFVTQRELHKMNLFPKYESRDPVQLFLLLKERLFETIARIALATATWALLLFLLSLWFFPSYLGMNDEIGYTLLKVASFYCIYLGILFTVNIFYFHYKGLVTQRSRRAWLQNSGFDYSQLRTEALLLLNESNELTKSIDNTTSPIFSNLLKDQVDLRGRLSTLLGQGEQWSQVVRDDDVWCVPLIEGWVEKFHMGLEQLKQKNTELRKALPSRVSN